MAAPLTHATSGSERLRHGLKWTVYVLLVLNFGYYAAEDWRAAQTVLSAESTWLDFANAYATTLDELGWFALLAIFEIETYWIEQQLDRAAAWLLGAVRVAAYAIVLHTIYAYAINVVDVQTAGSLTRQDGLCAFSSDSYSFLRNLKYSEITEESCAALSDDTRFRLVKRDNALTDSAGWVEALRLAWVDLIEATCWLLIILLIEAAIRLQDRGMFQSAWIARISRANIALYSVIVAAAVYWAFKGHWVYAWDEFLWVAGFLAIEGNLAEWRDDLRKAE